jgi:hypothetical protein
MNSTSARADAFLRARTRAATVTDPRVLDLRAEVAYWQRAFSAVVAENASLRARLDAMRAERDQAQRANRRRDWQGAIWALWDTLRGRTR